MNEGGVYIFYQLPAADVRMKLVDQSQLLPQLLERRAKEDPDRMFFQEVDGRDLTYGQFHREVLERAGAFRRLGVQRGERVASLLDPSADAHIDWVALSWLGAIEVPLNTEYRGRLLAHTLSNTGATVLVTTRGELERAIKVASDVPDLKTMVLLDTDDEPAEGPFRVVGRKRFLEAAVAPTDLEGPQTWDTSCIVFTSGTTGPSKGVVIPWMQQYLFGAQTIPIMDDMGTDDAFYAPWPVFHMSGKFAFYMMALVGGRIVTRPKFSITDFWSDIRAYGCTTAIMGAAVTVFVWKQPAKLDDADNPLRNVIMAPVIPDFQRFAERFGVRLCTTFAMTEIGAAIGYGFDQIPTDAYQAVGHVKDGYEARIVDNNDVEVPVGEVGELIIRSDVPWVLSAGYWALPVKTAESWRNGWFHTGDAFKQDEQGRMYFVDRFKDAIRRRGENISSMEVEAYVNDYPAVQESACVAVPSEFLEDDVKVLVVPREGETVDPAELVMWLAETMPRFMVPRYVEIVNELPKTPSQKIIKVELSHEADENTWDREQAGVKLPK